MVGGSAGDGLALRGSRPGASDGHRPEHSHGPARRPWAGLLAVVALAVLLWQGFPWIERGISGLPLPWTSGCTVLAPDGAEVFAGTIDEVREQLLRRGTPAARAAAAGPAVSCRVPAAPLAGVPKELPTGLTPAARALRRAVQEEFGDIPDGGYGPEETLPGRRPGGEHSLGRAIDFFFRPYTDANQERAGWALANWAVANSERLDIRTVIYRDRIWSARRSFQGWRPYRFPGADSDNPVNRHLDHVHIDVA